MHVRGSALNLEDVPTVSPACLNIGEALVYLV